MQNITPFVRYGQENSSTIDRTIRIFFPTLSAGFVVRAQAYKFIFSEEDFEQETFTGESIFKTIFESVPDSEVEDAEDFVTTLLGLRQICKELDLSNGRDLDDYMEQLKSRTIILTTNKSDKQYDAVKTLQQQPIMV